MHVLSVPTWMIHITSVIEWMLAISLIQRYAVATTNPRWQGLAWAMLPALLGAMAAITWHVFDNSPALEWLVLFQAAMTFGGNCTLAIAAYRLQAVPQSGTQSGGE